MRSFKRPAALPVIYGCALVLNFVQFILIAKRTSVDGFDFGIPAFLSLAMSLLAGAVSLTLLVFSDKGKLKHTLTRAASHILTNGLGLVVSFTTAAVLWASVPEICDSKPHLGECHMTDPDHTVWRSCPSSLVPSDVLHFRDQCWYYPKWSIWPSYGIAFLFVAGMIVTYTNAQRAFNLMKRTTLFTDSVPLSPSTSVPHWSWVNVAYQPVALESSEEEELEAMLPSYKP